MATSKKWLLMVLAVWSVSVLASPCFSDPKQAYAYLTKQQATKINLNTAHESELIELSGVGIKTAQAIVAYRRMHGGFKSVDELVHVKGIGEKTLAKNRERLFVDGRH